MSWHISAVTRSLKIRTNIQRPALDERLERLVSDAWETACNRHPSLFNGDVFTVDRIDGDLMEGHWTEYRRIITQLYCPDLAMELRLRPLAVAGLLHGPDGIVFGRRPADAVYQPGLWQLAPAGNVDRGAERNDSIDPLPALFAELEEELGLTPGDVAEVVPRCLVRHPGIGVLDLCISMSTTLDAAALRRAHSRHGNREYSELAIVPLADLSAFLEDQAAAMAPQTVCFLDYYRKQTV